MRKVTTLFLLLLATTHCVLSIFFVNLSYLDLPKYAAGLEPLPFQRRLLLIPFIRWAQNSHLLAIGASRFSRVLTQYEPLTAAKFGCMLLGVLMLNVLGLVSLRFARKLRLQHDWLPWAMLLVILYASYGARFEQAFWYPYDLPHMVLFGAATLCLLTDEPLLFLACMAVDVFIRETSIYLLLVAFFVRFGSTRWRIVSLVGVAVWISGRVLAQHLYPANIYNFNAVPWYRMGAPWHWPQVFSIVGFLWIPVLMSRKTLNGVQRMSLYFASLCMLASFFFATWNETRVWIEWSTLFAALASIEIEAAFTQPSFSMRRLS
jgi:hypothetical protein